MDAIQRQLAERDLHCSPWAILVHAVDCSPLVLLVAGATLGILLQNRIPVPLTAWLTLASGTAGTAWLYLRSPKSRPLQLAVWAALSCLCLGAVRMAYATRIDPHDVRQLLATGPRLVTLRGRVVRDIRIGERDWVFKALNPEEPSTRFTIQTSGIQTAQGWRRVHGIVGVWVGEPVDDLQIGDEIQLCGWLERLPPPTNPGQFDIASYLLDQGVVAAATLKSRQGIEPRPPSLLGSGMRWVYSMRHRTCLALACHWPDDPRTLGLVQALVLGVRADVQTDVSEAFYRTGLLHYVSLSGMHFAILVGVVWFLARVAGMLRPAAAATCSTAVGLFVLLIPAMAPAMRAAILCWVFCAGVLLRRQGYGMNTLALAALLLLLAWPFYLFDPSWQLSFACMAGIFLLSGPIERAVREGWRLVQPAGSDLTDGYRPRAGLLLLRKVARPILPLLCVGFGAWLASAGIVLYHFYNLTPLAPVWTVLVFPAVWAVMVLGVVKVLVSLLLHGLCPVTAWILAAATRVLIWAVDQLGHVDVFSLRVGHISPVPILLYYGLLAALLLIPVRRRPLWRATVLAVACVAIAWVGWTKWRHTHRSDLIVTCLDVGHGQAIVVQPPGSGALLLDAGSRVKADVGTRIVNPFLDYSGLSRLDAVVLSHTDVDHINGLPEVVGHCPAAGVYADANQTRPGASLAADLLRLSLEQQGCALLPLTSLPAPAGCQAEIRVLWPPLNGQELQTPSTNALSAVLLLRFVGRRILLCSDIEQDTQDLLCRLYPDLRVDALVVPHHGSTKTLAPGFISWLGPKILISSCGRSQYQQHQVIEPQEGQAAFYTARDGAVTLRVDPAGGMHAVGFLGEKARKQESKKVRR